MRLRETQAKLRRAVPELRKLRSENTTLGNNQPGMKLTGWTSALDGYSEVVGVEALAEAVDQAARTPWGDLPADPAFVLSDVGNRVVSNVTALTMQAAALLKALDALLPEQDPLSISIKLPQLADLAELQEVLEGLDIGIARPTAMLYGPSVTFQGFDIGSSWVNVAAKSAVALAFVAQVVRFGAWVAVEKQQIDANREFVRGLKLENDTHEVIAQAAEQRLREAMRTRAKELVDASAPEGLDDGQRNEAVNSAFQGAIEVAKLMKRDTQFVPALPMPGEPAPAHDEVEGAKKAFPDPEELAKRLKPAEPAIAQLPRAAAP